MDTYPTALVMGLASSGEAAARLLLAEGTSVWVVDRDDHEALQKRASALIADGARVQLGQSELPAGHFSVCIVSPGIPVDSAWVSSMNARAVPVMSELELGWSRAACRVLAISGSNGKSTLVKLCAEALAHAGRRVAIAGNYGPPASQVVMERRALDWLVLEVSSFQLETVRDFRPDIGVVLNVYPNHLDRHRDMAAYERLKSRLFTRMTEREVGIVHEEAMPKMMRLAASTNRWLSFGLSLEADFRYGEGAVYHPQGSLSLSLANTSFANDVLGLTAAAAVAALSVGGESPEHVAVAAREFEPLPHRMQDLGTRQGIRWINDSKATNLAALMAALRVVPAPIRLIAGGLPKHEPYETAKPLLKHKVAVVYLIGAAADAMASAWNDVVPCVMSKTLEYAVRMAWDQARPGEAILLSPACASFDQFRNFEERGNRFAEIVRSLRPSVGRGYRPYG